MTTVIKRRASSGVLIIIKIRELCLFIFLINKIKLNEACMLKLWLHHEGHRQG